MLIGSEEGRKSEFLATWMIKNISHAGSLLLGAASFHAQVLNAAISYCSDVTQDPLHRLFTQNRECVLVLNGVCGGLSVKRGLRLCLVSRITRNWVF